MDCWCDYFDIALVIAIVIFAIYTVHGIFTDKFDI